tara:strand:- start:18626 stop:18787 length:162 start_codon:yes stop_codon:yes gene_type:complete
LDLTMKPSRDIMIMVLSAILFVIVAKQSRQMQIEIPTIQFTDKEIQEWQPFKE